MTWVSVSFAPGPQRVETTEHDPDFVPRPIGFTAAWDPTNVPACPYCKERGRHAAQCRHAGNDCLPVTVREPLLWEGDQA